MNGAPNSSAIPPTGPHRFSREAVLFASLGLLAILFAFTAFLTRMFHHQIHVLADEWFAKGEASFQSHDVAGALTDYRNALVYSPNNPQFQFHLAQALAAGGRSDEARSYLFNLLSESPGSGEVNLELARIAAQQGAMADSLRYYHGAIYGVWDSDPIGMRWKIRRELCEYLLEHGASNQAVAEVIQLADNTSPTDIARQKIAAELLLQAQLWVRALSSLRAVLDADPQDAGALKGSGTAAFQLGHYSQAVEYFTRLPRDQTEDPKIAEMAEICRKVLAADPFLPGLSTVVRAQRVARALSIAVSRAQECARVHGLSLANSESSSGLQRAFAASQEMKVEWSERSLARHPDRVDAAMSLVFSLENLAAEECGAPEGEDDALWLLGRARGTIPP